MLWFDVERRYKTIHCYLSMEAASLWFDVERRYKTIVGQYMINNDRLWFDVERRYKTIIFVLCHFAGSCGLM